MVAFQLQTRLILQELLCEAHQVFVQQHQLQKTEPFLLHQFEQVRLQLAVDQLDVVQVEVITVAEEDK